MLVIGHSCLRVGKFVTFLQCVCVRVGKSLCLFRILCVLRCVSSGVVYTAQNLIKSAFYIVIFAHAYFFVTVCKCASLCMVILVLLAR
jgi:hypothetical protein